MRVITLSTILSLLLIGCGDGSTPSIGAGGTAGSGGTAATGGGKQGGSDER